MPQFNTREEVIGAFRTKNPQFANIDDNKVYNYVVSNKPEYAIESREEQYQLKPIPSLDELRRQEGNPTENSILDSNPILNTLKDGYNRSLTGMTQALTSNKQQVFDLKDYDPNIVQDIGAGLVSFFMPLDFATTIGGGVVGGIAAKSAAKATVRKYVFKKLVNNGVKKATAIKSANLAVARAQAVGTGANTLGLYQGANSALSQQLQNGDIQFNKVVKDYASGSALGAITGGTNLVLSEKGVGALTRVGADIGIFTATAPLARGEVSVPTPQDFISSAGMVLGLKGVGKTFSAGKDKISPYLKDYAENKRLGSMTVTDFLSAPKEKRERLIDDQLTSLSNRRDVENIYYRKKGAPVKITGRDGDKIFTESLDGNSKFKLYNKKYFDANFKTESFSKNPEVSRLKAERDIRTLEKKLGIKQKEKATNRYVNSGLVKKETLDKVMKNTSLGKKPELKKFNSKAIFTYKDRLMKDYDLKLTLKKLEKQKIILSKESNSFFFDTLLPEKVSKFLDPFRATINQGSNALARRIHNGDMYRWAKDSRERQGSGLSAMKEIGLLDKPTNKDIQSLARALGKPFKEVSANYNENLTKAMRDGKTEVQQVLNMRRIYDKFHNDARIAGVPVSGKIPNYVPNISKEGVSAKIIRDLDKISKEVYKTDRDTKEKYANATEFFDYLVTAMIEPDKMARLNPGTANIIDTVVKNSQNIMSKETRNAISYVRGENKQSKLSYFKALSDVGNELYRVKHGKSSHLETRRKRILPDSYYENDIVKLTARYISDASKRTSEVKIFGKGTEYIDKLLRNKEISQIDKDIIAELQAHVSGSIKYQSQYSKGVIGNIVSQQNIDRILFWNTATKIGLGTATALNLTQLLTSAGMEAGYGRMLKGSYKYVTDKNFRKLVDSSGADLYKISHELMGFSNSETWLRSFADVTTKWSGFNSINSVNNVIAASTASVFVDDLINIVQKGGTLRLGNLSRKQQVAWAKNKLSVLGVDIKDVQKKGRLSNKKRLEVMGSFAGRTQLQRDLLQDPLFLNRPSLRLFTQFKTFGVRNANYMSKSIENDLYNYNFMPLLRLAATGIAGAGIALKAKEKMKNFFSGEESYEPEKFINTDGKEIIQAISSVGAFGWFSSVLSPLIEDGKGFGLVGSVKFLTLPAFWSDIENAFKIMDSLENDFVNYKGEAIARVPNKLLKLTNTPIARDIAKAVETKGLKEGRVKSQRSRKLGELRNALIEDRGAEARAKARQEVRDWNKYISSLPAYYRKYRLAPTDISIEEVMEAIKRKRKKEV